MPRHAFFHFFFIFSLSFSLSWRISILFRTCLRHFGRDEIVLRHRTFCRDVALFRGLTGHTTLDPIASLYVAYYDTEAITYE